MNYFLLQSKQYLTRIYTCQETIKQKRWTFRVGTQIYDYLLEPQSMQNASQKPVNNLHIFKFLITKQKKNFTLNLNNGEHVWKFA